MVESENLTPKYTKIEAYDKNTKHKVDAIEKVINDIDLLDK